MGKQVNNNSVITHNLVIVIQRRALAYGQITFQTYWPLNEYCFILKSIAISIISELFDDSIVVVLLHMTNTVVPPIIFCIKPVSEMEQCFQSTSQAQQ